MLLALWIGGVFGTAAFVKWWVDGRGILPLAPAVGITGQVDRAREAIHEGGDHVIIVGRIREIAYQDGDCQPLLYYKGRYGAVSP